MGGTTVMLVFLCQANPRRQRARPEHSKRLAARIGHYTPEKTRTYEGMIRTLGHGGNGVGASDTAGRWRSILLSFWIQGSGQSGLTTAQDGLIVPTIVKPDADSVAKGRERRPERGGLAG